MRSAVVPKLKALSCPNCGAAVELRSHGNAINAVCTQCLAVLDARTPGLEIIRKFEGAQKFIPLLKLGSRATLHGTLWELIGFQRREIVVEGVTYGWGEYLLYNPYKGYAYLSEYQGHWNFIRTLSALPLTAKGGTRRAMLFEGKTFRHFQTARATTAFVLGEFPWQAGTGDEVDVEDFVNPPLMLSSERTVDEVTWSIGTYTPVKEIAAAFSPETKLPAPSGTYSNQPSPVAGRVASAWKTAGILALLLIGLTVCLAIATRGEQVFSGRYTYVTKMNPEAAFVTPIFPIRNRSNVEIALNTSLNNDWAFFSLALINDDTGVAWDFGKEISYYFGRDSDGNWTEGSRSGEAMVPAVPPGRYYLRVEPEMADDANPHIVYYEIVVKSGAMYGYWIVLAFLLIPLPALWITWRSVQFESARWAESDYGSIFTSSTSEDDE